MQGKEVDIQLLRDESARAGVAEGKLVAARNQLTALRDLFSGDHWGASAEGQALKNALVGTVDNRLKEVEQLVSAAAKIRTGLAQTADLEEKTEQAIMDALRRTPIS